MTQRHVIVGGVAAAAAAIARPWPTHAAPAHQFEVTHIDAEWKSC